MTGIEILSKLVGGRSSLTKSLLTSFCMTTVLLLITNLLMTHLFLQRVASIQLPNLHHLAPWWALVCLAPLLETLLLWGALEVLRRLLHSPLTIAIIVSLGFSALHAWNSWIQGAFAAWTFFIYAAIFLTWNNCSRWKPWLICILVHIANNGSIIATSIIIESNRKDEQKQHLLIYNNELFSALNNTKQLADGRIEINISRPSLTHQDLENYFSPFPLSLSYGKFPEVLSLRCTGELGNLGYAIDWEFNAEGLQRITISGLLTELATPITTASIVMPTANGLFRYKTTLTSAINPNTTLSHLPPPHKTAERGFTSYLQWRWPGRDCRLNGYPPSIPVTFSVNATYANHNLASMAYKLPFYNNEDTYQFETTKQLPVK